MYDFNLTLPTYKLYSGMRFQVLCHGMLKPAKTLKDFKFVEHKVMVIEFSFVQFVMTIFQEYFHLK